MGLVAGYDALSARPELSSVMVCVRRVEKSREEDGNLGFAGCLTTFSQGPPRGRSSFILRHPRFSVTILPTPGVMQTS